MSELDSSPRSSDEIAELQAHVRKFEAHLNNLELELHVTAHERDEARQRAERAEAVVKAAQNYIALPSGAAFVELRMAVAALATDQPGEAGGEE